MGGSLHVDQVKVLDDLILSGGSIFVGPDTQVADSATVLGGAVNLAGQFSRQVRIVGGDVKLSGRFLGPVHVEAETLTLLEGATLQGDLSYSAAKFDVQTGAKVLGRKVELPRKESSRWGGAAGIFWGIVLGLLFGFGVFLVPGVVAWALPAQAEQVSASIRLRFWESLGKGTLAVLGIPVLWLLLLMSVVGIPLGLVAIPVLMLLPILAWTGASYTLGILLKERTQAKRSGKSADFAWTMLGGVLLAFTSAIPFLGAVISTAALLVGVGAVATVVQQYFSKQVRR